MSSIVSGAGAAQETETRALSYGFIIPISQLCQQDFARNLGWDMRSILIMAFENWRSTMRMFGACGIESPAWNSFAAAFSTTKYNAFGVVGRFMQKISHYVSLILITVLPICSFGEDSTSKHRIDVWLEQKISKDPSTAGMRAALNQAREMWDAEMNRVYNRLMARLSPEQQNALRESQRAWLTFRDAEGKAIELIIASKAGTMWQLSGTDEGMQLVRSRVLRLLTYEQDLNE